jgi:hypothetical protein
MSLRSPAEHEKRVASLHANPRFHRFLAISSLCHAGRDCRHPGSQDVSGGIHVNLGSSTPCWNDEIEGSAWTNRGPSSTIFSKEARRTRRSESFQLLNFVTSVIKGPFPRRLRLLPPASPDNSCSDEKLQQSVVRGVSLVESGHKTAKLRRLMRSLAVVCVFPRWLRHLLSQPTSSRYRPIGRDRRGLLLGRHLVNNPGKLSAVKSYRDIAPQRLRVHRELVFDTSLRVLSGSAVRILFR